MFLASFRESWLQLRDRKLLVGVDCWGTRRLLARHRELEKMSTKVDVFKKCFTYRKQYTRM